VRQELRSKEIAREDIPEAPIRLSSCTADVSLPDSSQQHNKRKTRTQKKQKQTYKKQFPQTVVDLKRFPKRFGSLITCTVSPLHRRHQPP
jgi:hypothetical protein